MPFTRSEGLTAAEGQPRKSTKEGEALFALVDCDNFFVSCERIFDPKLENRPVVVLSNNDACVISRSNEAKALGIQMGVPLFQVDETVMKQGVRVLSANFTLYRDISRRIGHCLKQFCADIEVYSVDEVFMAFQPTKAGTLGRLIKTMRSTVGQWIGVPVSIGVGESKTLAKLAASYAKKNKSTGGCLDLTACTPEERDRIMAASPVDKVWGIGRQHEKWLVARGITTALQLRHIDQDWFGEKAGVTGRRTVQELQGISCIPLDCDNPPRKMITCSRSFGKPVTDLEELKEAIATFAAQAGRELRHDRSVAGALSVFCVIRRNAANDEIPRSTTVTLSVPTDRDSDLIDAALNGLKRIYRLGIIYIKAGVTLGNLSPADVRQIDIFANRQPDHHDKVSEVVDHLNAHWGHGTVRSAATGTHRGWHSRASLRSPNYTTSWQELPVANALSPDDSASASANKIHDEAARHAE